MRKPTCPKCAGTSFEIGEIEIRNAAYVHNAIVCSACGCVVGLEEQRSVSYMLGKLAERLGVSFG